MKNIYLTLILVVAPLNTPSFHVDYDYIHYYKLRKNCAIFIEADNQDFCHPPYDEFVYDHLRFGLNGCNTCLDVIQNCHPDFRATNIKFEDGFQMETDGFYAHDVDCNKLP